MDQLVKAKRKATGVIRMVARHIRTRCPRVLKMVWSLYIEPILTFGSNMWHSGFKYIREGADSICNRFWNILGVTRPKSCPKPSDRMLLKDLQMMHKIVNGRIKLIDPNDHVWYTADVRNRAYEDQHLFKPRLDNEVSKCSFFQRTVEVWNTVPLRVRNLTNYECFSNKVMRLIRERKVVIISPRDKPK